MEAPGSSKTSVYFYNFTQRQIHEINYTVCPLRDKIISYKGNVTVHNTHGTRNKNFFEYKKILFTKIVEILFLGVASFYIFILASVYRNNFK
jgi:hypothetical protein